VWAAAGLALVGVVIGIVSNRPLSLRLIGMVGNLPGKFGQMSAKLEAAYEPLALMLRPSNLFFPTLLSAAAWLLECLSLRVILAGFGESTTVALSTFFYATSTLAGAIVPVPGGLGVTEGSLMGQLTELGHVSSTIATASMLLVRFATLWFAVLVGFVALSLMKHRHPGLLANDPGATKAPAREQAEPS